MPPDDDHTLPPGDKFPQAPSVGLAAELTEVRDEARALIEVLTKSHHTNQPLPSDFPREPLIDVAKSLMQLRDAETDGIEVVLGYARLRLTAVRRRHVAPSERPDLPEYAPQAPPRGGVLDNKLALLIAAVSTALDQIKRGDLQDDPDERDPGIEIRGDKRVDALNETTAGLQAALDEGAEQLKAGKLEGSKLADAASRSTESASAILRAARAETRMPEVVPSWSQRLSSGLKSAAGAVRQTLPYLKAGVDVTEKVHNYLRDFSDRAGKAFWTFVYDEARNAVDGFNRFLSEVQGDPSVAPPPAGFSIDKVHEMILAGQAPPRSWVPRIKNLGFEETNLSNLKPLSGLTSLQTLDLDGTEVSDVSALSGLTELQSLDLRVTQVSDVSALSGLTALQQLYLNGTQVNDVSALSGLTALQGLYLTGTQVSDVSALSGLTALQWLYLDGTQVSDVSALSGLTELQELDLRGTKVQSLAPLAALKNLNKIYVDKARVAELAKTHPRGAEIVKVRE